MPSKSKAQHNFMAAVANNPTFAKKVGVPQSVGQDFSKADKGRKFSKGGDTMASKMNAGFMAMMAKKKGAPAKKMAGGGITTAKMGTVKTAAPSKDGMATKGKTKGTMVKMSGSKPLGMKSGGKTC
jgi:DNA uptake protein ComE-like DNA-binding protein